MRARSPAAPQTRDTGLHVAGKCPACTSRQRISAARREPAQEIAAAAAAAAAVVGEPRGQRVVLAAVVATAARAVEPVEAQPIQARLHPRARRRYRLLELEVGVLERADEGKRVGGVGAEAAPPGLGPAAGPR